MQVIVLGAGVVGVATAYYLNQAGHQVTVIDRAAGVADETSYANAGQLSFGYTTPWAAPNIPMKALKWLGKKHSPLIIRPDGSLFQMRWLAQMTANCNSVAYSRNQSRMMRISEYSRALLHQFEAEEKLDFEQRHQGTLHLFRDATLFRQHCQSMGVLDSFNVPYQQLDADGVLQFEPALAHIRHQIAGAFHLPNDSTGDCRLFTQKLAQLLQTRGVQFVFNSEISRFEVSGSLITGVHAGGQMFTADAFVCALGSFSRTVLQQIGLDLPVYPVKGYSLTIPIADENRAPQSTVLDETYKVALTRFNNRIRVGGMAELSGYQIRLPETHKETLSMVVNELFPHGGYTEQAEYWSGLRPMTPDSTPIIGKTRFDNLFTNTGHGTLGWTMSLGSGKLTADCVGGKTTDIQADDLGMARYACA
ncbi:MAG: D-amino acid dehydrogenase [Alysiella sp.]|uniref:D-amino acid dehydrogenase n=1 Tax=Alysiella sp. TaxID=1872483 RepID=UPI0026DDAEB7|nr:D-amino acid dehydrogenase [Alysiella sp.]MDO4433166.1 D-amino acid dehydrogenase [Alysiella sp.]